jgi:hypothetical protein
MADNLGVNIQKKHPKEELYIKFCLKSLDAGLYIPNSQLAI